MKFSRPRIFRNLTVIGKPIAFDGNIATVNQRKSVRTSVIVRKKVPTVPPAEAVLDDSLADQLQTWDYRACGKHLVIANLNLQMKYGLIIKFF